MIKGIARLGVGARVAALLCAALIVSPTAALAHHGPNNMFPTSHTASFCYDGTFGGSNTFCRTDNATLTTWVQSSITDASGINATLNSTYNTTDLNVVHVSSPVYSGEAETDIIYQQGSLSGTFIGYAWCNDAQGYLTCDQAYARFLSHAPGRAVACHETGHDVGLTHPTEADPRSSSSDPAYACMTNSSNSIYLGAHNTYIVNAYY